MKRRTLIKATLAGVSALSLPKMLNAGSLLSDLNEPSMKIADGPYQPDWNSLAQYQLPDWFRDAKFGMWAHWGPQCEPERGDWYARGMYLPGDQRYREHLEQYGHPSEFGFKDVINVWKAENWDPESIVAMYKRAGAEYFVTMANHHDN